MSENLDVAGFRPISNGSDEPVKPQETQTPEQTPVVPAAPVEPSPFDFKQFGEEFDSQDKLKQFIDISRETQSKVKSYEEELSSLKGRPVYADEALYKLDQVKRTHPEKFDLARDLLFGKIDDLSLVRLGLEYGDPILEGLDAEDKKAYLEHELERKYKLSHDLVPIKEEEGYTEEEVRQRSAQIASEERRIRAEKVALSIDAGRVKKSIEDQLFSGIEFPKFETREEAEKREAEAVTRLAEAWKEPMQQLAGIKSVTIEVWDSKEEKAKSAFDMQVPEPALKKYLDEFNSHIVQNGWTPEQVSVNDAKAFIETRFREDNLPKILHEWGVKARNASNEEWQNLVYNPQRPVTPSVVPSGGGSTRTTDDSLKRAISKA